MQYRKAGKFKKIITCGLLLFICLYGKAQESATLNWQLVKDKDAIKVYTATPASGSLKYIKVEALLSGTIDKFISIFKNVPGQHRWVYKTKQSYIIHENTDNDFLYYNETALPWPMSDRDVAIHMIIKEDTLHHQLFISTVGVPKAIPVNDNIVRVPHFEGNWTVHVAGPGMIHVEYFLNLDPGGTIPAWIINLFVTKGPYETFQNLAHQLKS
jgi:hypothetical protein